MEINITQFFNDADAYEFSGSRAERGENAARETWNNALSEAKTKALLSTEAELQAMRDWAKASGGWNAEEIAEWTADELNALFIQLVSGDMRQIEDLCTTDAGETDWTEYEKLAEEGRISGTIFRTDAGEVFYYLGE